LARLRSWTCAAQARRLQGFLPTEHGGGRPTADADETTGWLSETGSWKPGALFTRPWLYVI
jgi:hypothetical protein